MILGMGRFWVLIPILLVPVGLAGCALHVLGGVAQVLVDAANAAANDPGPTATVAMVPLGPSSAAALEVVDRQTQTDSSRCARNARSDAARGARNRSQAIELATKRYVLCMVDNGYRCVTRSDHMLCEIAWNHPTAVRAQWLEDKRMCYRAAFSIWIHRDTIRSRYLECMTSKGYRADVGEPSSGDAPLATATPADPRRQELIEAAKTHYCRKLHPADDAAYRACLAE